jgi:hypothetical protein
VTLRPTLSEQFAFFRDTVLLIGGKVLLFNNIYCTYQGYAGLKKPCNVTSCNNMICLAARIAGGLSST